MIGYSLESNAMSSAASGPHGRTFLSGKIILNYGGPALDCTLHRLSDEGATIELESVMGIPERFHLSISNENEQQWRKRISRSDKHVGGGFDAEGASSGQRETDQRSAETMTRRRMLALRAAFDHVPVGIVLLDPNMNSQFINRAFRKMWALPDTTADSNPPFAALMYHGCDTNAYEVPPPDKEAYVAERIRLVRAGDPTPLDLRRSNGEVIRMHCTALPDGGRVLSYTFVTDLVRYADELAVLKDALEHVQDGILLLDADMNARFVNGRMRTFWEIEDREAATRLSYASLVSRARRAVAPNLAADEIASFCVKRVAEVVAGDHVRDLQTPDGRRIRAHCTNLVGGGRMLTYCDISDLMRNAEQLEKLATTDSLTGLHNRRHFLSCAEAEWSRFLRYHRAVSVLMLDIDHFKSVNDRYGHAVGDEVICAVAEACATGKRKPDIVGRFGGEEFAILLPETTSSSAMIVAERIRNRLAEQALTTQGVTVKVTASIGVAEASAGMSGFGVLMRNADQALYQAKANGRNRVACWSLAEPSKLAAE
jgi:diguanylate cyclase (GGDEF)-like protein